MNAACWRCGYTFDLHTHMDSTGGPETLEAVRGTPVEGDVSICVECGALGVFTAGGGLRRPSEAEQAELIGDAQVVQVSRFLEGTRRDRHERGL